MNINNDLPVEVLMANDTLYSPKFNHPKNSFPLSKAILDASFNNKKEYHILDYGSGIFRKNSEELRKLGYLNVHDFDFGNNWREGMVYEVKEEKYDLIYANNVVNSWVSPELMQMSLEEIKKGLKSDGVFLVNYPKFPRSMPRMKNEDFANTLSSYFSNVVMIEEGIWNCKK